MSERAPEAPGTDRAAQGDPTAGGSSQDSDFLEPDDPLGHLFASQSAKLNSPDDEPGSLPLSGDGGSSLDPVVLDPLPGSPLGSDQAEPGDGVPEPDPGFDSAPAGTVSDNASAIGFLQHAEDDSEPIDLGLSEPTSTVRQSFTGAAADVQRLDSSVETVQVVPVQVPIARWSFAGAARKSSRADVPPHLRGGLRTPFGSQLSVAYAQLRRQSGASAADSVPVDPKPGALDATAAADVPRVCRRYSFAGVAAVRPARSKPAPVAQSAVPALSPLGAAALAGLGVPVPRQSFAGAASRSRLGASPADAAVVRPVRVAFCGAAAPSPVAVAGVCAVVPAAASVLGAEQRARLRRLGFCGSAVVRPGPVVSRLGFSGSAVARQRPAVSRLGFSGSARYRRPRCLGVARIPFAGVSAPRRLSRVGFTGMTARLPDRLVPRRLAFAGVARRVIAAGPHCTRLAFVGKAFGGRVARLGFSGRSRRLISHVPTSTVGWVGAVRRLGFGGSAVGVARRPSPPARLGFYGPVAPCRRLGFAGRSSSWSVPVRAATPPVRRVGFSGLVAPRVGFRGASSRRRSACATPRVAFRGCAARYMPAPMARVSFSGSVGRVLRVASAGAAAPGVHGPSLSESEGSSVTALGSAGAPVVDKALRRRPARLGFSGVSGVPLLRPLQTASWGATLEKHFRANRPPIEQVFNAEKDLALTSEEQNSAQGTPAGSSTPPVNRKPTDPEPKDEDVLLQRSIGLILEDGRDAEELEQELLEHMQDSGMDVDAHRARLKAALQQSSRKTSAIEFQADFQQALSGWRKGTRRTAAEVQVILDDLRERSNAIMRQYLFIESGVTLFQGKLKEVDSTIDEHRTAIEDAAAKQTKRLNDRVVSVTDKLNDLMTSLTGRLDKYSQDVQGRTNNLFKGSQEAAAGIKDKFQELDESAEKALATMKSAETRVHSIETRSAVVDRELKEAEQRFTGLLSRFQTPMAMAAFGGGVVGACVAALVAVLVWILLDGSSGG